MSAISYIKAVFNEISPRANITSLSKNIKGDTVAGITVGIIALPLALAFGEISQLGPIAGVWGAIAGGIIGGFFGGCLVGVSGPTAPKAAQIAPLHPLSSRGRIYVRYRNNSHTNSAKCFCRT